MGKRTTKTTDGKNITFSYDGKYYLYNLINSNGIQEVFKGWEKFSACVIYTRVIHDVIDVIEMNYGVPMNVCEDNGLVGYQNFNFFKTIDEAKEDFKLRCKLSPKVGVIGYADVFMVINNNIKK